MKKLCLTVFTGLTTIILFGQDKKDLTISIGAGIINSPYYTNAKPYKFYNFDFEYHITDRHKISTNFLSGRHRYFDSVHSNNFVSTGIPGYEDNANAEAEYKTFTLLYKYKLLNKKKVSLSLGAGAGFMVQIFQFPYTEGNITDFREATSTGLILPVKLEFDYKISTHFQFGFLSGFFIGPDYPVLGYHVGPRVTYVVK
jgi:hypothetical protein